MNPEVIRNIVGAVMQSSGNFTSTKGGNKNMVGWSPSNGDANSDQSSDLSTLRAQSRDLVRNSSIAAGAVSTPVLNVVGTGIKPQPQPIRTILGWDKKKSLEWRKRAEALFWIWADNKNCDSTMVQNFWQMQAMIFRSFLESGDCFVLRRQIKGNNSPITLSLQVVEADRVSNPDLADDSSTKIGGVEIDANGRPLRYHICSVNPNDYSNYGDRKWIAVDASKVLHVMSRVRPGQSRGVPFLAPAIEPLKQLQRFTEAELTAAVVTAMIAIFIKSDKSSGPIIAGQVPGAVSGPNGVTVGGSAVPVAPKGTNLAQMRSGGILELQPGESTEAFDPKRPSGAFDPFFKAMVREVGVALSIPAEVLMKVYESSYTAARAAMLDARKEWEQMHMSFRADFLDPVWGFFVEECVARGYLDAPDFFTDPLKRAAYLSVQWSIPPMGEINPSVEIDAIYKKWSLGLTTLQNECQRNGSDSEENLEQIESEKEKLSSMWNFPNPSIVSAPYGPWGEVKNTASPGSGTVDPDSSEEDSEDDAEDSDPTDQNKPMNSNGGV